LGSQQPQALAPRMPQHHPNRRKVGIDGSHTIEAREEASAGGGALFVFSGAAVIFRRVLAPMLVMTRTNVRLGL
jgi:hypothetical protein